MGKFTRQNVAANQKKEVHIAVDFGTTFSCAAWAVATAGAQASRYEHQMPALHAIEMVSGYPDGEEGGRNVFEAPTEILYQGIDNPTLHWAYEARTFMKENQEASRWRSHFARMIKLLLSEGENAKDIREDLEQRFVKDKKTKVDVLVDFLKPFHDHIIGQISGFENHSGNFNSYDILWTFTVPAGWTPRARRDMKEAVILADFRGKSIKFISEPEAAALYILEYHSDQRADLQLETAYVVGDLGGGTMDFATFQTIHLNPLSLKRLAGVTGCTIGSRDLEERFASHVGDRLQDDFDYLERRSGDTREVIKQSAKEWFENKKKGFQGRNTKDYLCPIAHLKENEAKRFRNGFLEITSHEIADIFDGIIEVICEFLEKQIRKTMEHRKKSLTFKDFAVKTIFLTGGLSANRYVCERVKKHFEDETIFGHSIFVGRTPVPEQCVVKGAVWRSMHPESISSRMSETSYGFPQNIAYTEPWTHGGPGPERNPVTGGLEMIDRMNWVIKKDQNLRNGQRVPYELGRSVPMGRSLQFEECLFYSDQVNKDRVHYLHPDIHQIGPLAFNLEKWRNRFETDINDEGLEYMKVVYTIISVVDEDDWKYEIEVLGERTAFGGSTDVGVAFKLSQGLGEWVSVS